MSECGAESSEHRPTEIINLLTGLEYKKQTYKEEIYYNKLFVINELRYLFQSVVKAFIINWKSLTEKHNKVKLRPRRREELNHDLCNL